MAYASRTSSWTQQSSVVNTSSTCHFNNREISAIRAIGPIKCGMCSNPSIGTSLRPIQQYFIIFAKQCRPMVAYYIHMRPIAPSATWVLKVKSTVKIPGTWGPQDATVAPGHSTMTYHSTFTVISRDNNTIWVSYPSLH